MNKKGFSLVELLGALVLLGIILCIGLYSSRGTLATTLSTLTNVSTNEIYSAAKTYVLENEVDWIVGDEEYTCLTVTDLIDAGYFDENEILSYKNDKIKIIREGKTKVITYTSLVDDCE